MLIQKKNKKNSRTGHAAPHADVLVELASAAVAFRSSSSSSSRHVTVLHDVSGRRSLLAAACIVYVSSNGDARSFDFVRALSPSFLKFVPTQTRYFTYFSRLHQENAASDDASKRVRKRIDDALGETYDSQDIKPFIPSSCVHISCVYLVQIHSRGSGTSDFFAWIVCS